MAYIELLGRGDRLGANITSFISQIIYAHKNNLYVKFDRNFIKSGDNVRFVPYNQEFNNSIFIESLFDFLDQHNENIILDNVEDKVFSIHFFEMTSKVVLDIKSDLYSYFKKHIWEKIKFNFYEKAKNKNYNIPFVSENTITVHLRLDDVKGASDYDGRKCFNIFLDHINDDKIADNALHYKAQNMHGTVNLQSPIPFDRIQECINDIKINDKNLETVILTSPNEDLKDINYKVISHHDESYDLFLLCNSKYSILSRSTFALSSLFYNSKYNNQTFIPAWGHCACFSLGTKYQKFNRKIKMFF